jgi:hypothetical protein
MPSIIGGLTQADASSAPVGLAAPPCGSEHPARTNTAVVIAIIRRFILRLDDIGLATQQLEPVLA